MTAQQVYLIRKTFAKLSRHDHVAALVFYRRLFEIDPSLRGLFTNSIEAQAHKLMDMLGVLISMLERPVGLDMELRAMGGRHATYGVKDEHYTTVGRAFLDMLAETLEKDFTPEVRAAWTALYSMVATAMQTGAKETEEALKITE